MFYLFFPALLLCKELDKGTISCSGDQKIKIISANYGRKSSAICPDVLPINTIDCSLDIVSTISGL